MAKEKSAANQTMSAAELRRQILAIDDRPLVPVKAWGLQLYVRPLTNRQRAELERAVVRNPGTKRQEIDTRGFNERLVVYGTCDENGNPIFTEEDVAALSAKSAKEVSALAETILEISGMGRDSNESLKDN